MKPNCLLILTLAGIAAVGCADGKRAFAELPSEGRWMTGVVVDWPPDHKFVDLLTEVKAGGEGLSPALTASQVIETEHTIKITVRYMEGGTQKEAHALLGPNPGQPKGKGWFEQSTLTFWLVTGWVYLSNWPMAETDRVTAGAEGTTMVVQIDGSTHRVYLPWKDAGSTVTVTLKDSGKPPKVLTNAGDYTQHSLGSADLTDPAAVPPGPIADFLADVKTMATAAGVGR